MAKKNKKSKLSSLGTILMWDWKDQIDVDELNKALALYDNPRATEVVTGNDDYGLVITEPLHTNKAQQIYDDWMEEFCKA